MINALLIDRCSRQCERQDSRPRDAEREMLDTHSSNSFDVLLIVVVVLVGDIAFGSIVLHKDVHQRW